jgi:hypothetical protein
VVVVTVAPVESVTVTSAPIIYAPVADVPLIDAVLEVLEVEVPPPHATRKSVIKRMLIFFI